jgi:hypothetical protein
MWNTVKINDIKWPLISVLAVQSMSSTWVASRNSVSHVEHRENK